tara:strand:- start:263 stop:844 length:582 start_codon:yes stop_codon:yes gene_type:complete
MRIEVMGILLFFTERTPDLNPKGIDLDTPVADLDGDSLGAVKRSDVGGTIYLCAATHPTFTKRISQGNHVLSGVSQGVDSLDGTARFGVAGDDEWYLRSDDADERGIFNSNSSTRVRDITDGTSNTMAAGERMWDGNPSRTMKPTDQNAKVPSGPVVLTTAKSTRRYSVPITRMVKSSANSNLRWTWISSPTT